MSKEMKPDLEGTTPTDQALKLSTNPNTITHRKNTKIDAHLKVKAGPDVPIVHGTEIDSGITTDAPSTGAPSCRIQ